MKELANQPKLEIHPLQRDLSLTILSHLANGQLGNLDSNASSVLNKISAPVEFEFPNEEQASKAVVELVRGTLDVFWGKSSTKNVKDQQLVDNVCLLKNQGLNRDEVLKRLNLHFSWGINSQKI